MYKRIFPIMSLFVVVAMVLGACAPAATPTPKPTTPPQPTATTAAPKEEIGTDARPLVNVFVPSGDTQKIVDGGKRLDALLKSKYGIVTQSSVATSYAAAIEALCAGKADIVWLATLSYVLAHDKCDAVLALISVRRGSSTYKGQILVRADSGINSIADLKGKKFAFTDPASTSGYLYPLGLLKKNGVDPKDLAEAVFTGSHNAAALALYKGSVDAAATFVDVRDQLEKDFPDIKEKTKVLATTDPIPNDTITFRKDLPASIQKKFKEAMLDLVKTEEGKKIVYDIYEWDGAVEGDDALFEPVRQAAAAQGIQLQNWKGVSVPYKVGQVTDMGGIDDKSFNATAWKGIKDAEKSLFVEGKYLESQQQADYAKNIQQFLDEKLDLIITVGFLLGVDTAKAAIANPNQKFAIVDYAYPDCGPGATPGKDCGSDKPLANVLGLTFATDEAAFLAGYLAAGMTKTGKVGTFGGIKIPPVTIFMKGFEAGVKYYNQVKGTKVEVLGWNTAKDEGLFTGNFESTDDGRRFAESLVEEGADIILPVAGPVGLGSAAACKERGCLIIGVDTDWYVSAPEFKEVYLTSILKRMDVAVFDAIKSLTRGTFKGGVYVGTLKNNGVGIAPYHEFESKIPDTLKAEVEQVKKDLIDGKITVDGVLKGQ
jgi:basic membrane protein A